MSALDLTKPLRTKGGRPAELVAVNPSDALVRRLEAEDAGGGRELGQNILAEVTSEDGYKRLRWYYSDGRYMPSPSAYSDLENVPPEPVVVKSRRGVRVRHNGEAMTTACLHGVAAVLELTVTNGKLTNVEIVE